MGPSYDCAASVLLCAEDNAAILGLDDDDEDCSWAAAAAPATPPRHGAAADGFFMDYSVRQTDGCIAALVEREVEHMPMEGYPQMLLPRLGGLDLAAVRRDAIDWIWKVIEHYNFAPLTAVLSVNYLDRSLSVYELPEDKDWVTKLLAVASYLWLQRWRKLMCHSHCTCRWLRQSILRQGPYKEWSFWC